MTASNCQPWPEVPALALSTFDLSLQQIPDNDET